MPTPDLGYGQRGEAPIDAVNQWMRTQPWYQQLLSTFGQSPNNVHLSDAQKTQVLRAAQANGVVVDEGHDGQEVDDSGNFQAKGHGLRNTLIVAGIAGAALATMGAAGVFAGGAGAAGGGAGAAGAGGTLAASSTVPAVGGLVAGGTGLAAGAAGGASVAGASAVPWGSIISAGSNLFGNLFGAHAQSDAAQKAAEQQVAASKYAADLQDAASRRSELFLRQQAENDWRNQELTRKQNYGQYVAQRSRLGTLGAMLGLPAPDIPAYESSIDPGYEGGGAPSAQDGPSSTAAGPSAPVDGSPASISAFFKSKGVSDQETPYWVSKWPELVARGKEINNPNYAMQRLLAADVFGGGGAAQQRPLAAPMPPPTGTLGTMVQPYRVANPTAALNPYGTLARMM